MSLHSLMTRLGTKEHVRYEMKLADNRLLRSFVGLPITVTGMYCMPDKLLRKFIC